MNNRPSDIIRALVGMNRSISTAITETSRELQGMAPNASFRGPLSEQVDQLTEEFDGIVSMTRKNLAEIQSIVKVDKLETIAYNDATQLMPNRRYKVETATLKVITLPRGQEGDVIAFIGNILDSSARITLLAEELNQVIDGSTFSCHVYWFDGKWRYVANNFDTIVRRSRGSNGKGHYRIGPNMIQMFMRAVPGTTAEWPIAWPDDFRIVKTLVSTQSAKSVTNLGYRIESARGQYESILRPMHLLRVGAIDRVNVLKGKTRDIAWIAKTTSDIFNSSGTSLAFVNSDGTIDDFKSAGLTSVFTSIAPVKGFSFDGIGFYASATPQIYGVFNNIDGNGHPKFINTTILSPYALASKHKKVFSWTHDGRTYVVLTCATDGNVAGENDKTLFMELTSVNGQAELTGLASIPVRFDGTLAFNEKNGIGYIVGFDTYGNQVNALTLHPDGTFYVYSSPMGIENPIALSDCYHLNIADMDLFVVNALSNGPFSNNRAYKALYDESGNLAIAQVPFEANGESIETMFGESTLANGAPYVYENVLYIAYSLALSNIIKIVRPEWTGTSLQLTEEYPLYQKNTGLLTKYSVNDRDYLVSAPASLVASHYDNAFVFEIGSRRAEVDVMVTGVRDSMLHNPIVEIE